MEVENFNRGVNKTKGQILPVVIAIVLFLIVMIPTIVEWTRHQTRTAKKLEGRNVATNLAEAGINRGVWKLKISTYTWELVSNGIPIVGYNFDNIYTDIPGGMYRIKFSSGPEPRHVTIIAEGKDDKTGEVRAIKAVFKNQTIPGSIISRGHIYLGNAFECHWGPVMSHGNIQITDANIAKKYYPRKFAKGVVSSVPSYPRDTNGLDPPNTDNTEWWSDYPVPDLPILDFTTLRSSAATNIAVYLVLVGTTTSGGRTFRIFRWEDARPVAQPPPANWFRNYYPSLNVMSSATINTLNFYACSSMNSYRGPKYWQEVSVRTDNYSVSYNDLSSCNLNPGQNHDGRPHFQNPWRHPAKFARRVWYYDGDLIMTGSTGADGCGIKGQLIVRGNFTNYTGDNLRWTGNVATGLTDDECKVPPEAHLEYRKIDTSAINQYPADNGLRSVRSVFRFGQETWTDGPTAANTDIGLAGFLYVGGDYDMEGPMDIYGAIWVVGNVSRGTGVAEYSIIFFDETLDLPSLNVVLIRTSWQTIPPSNIPW
ncbi:MAG: hypothetical protein N2555_04700 [Endomicrobia bacterium]|nr:hypothetical protein [Endomicrobiia bacterium]